MRAHVVAIVATNDGKGYWIACSTGGVFSFGDAKFYGSARAGTPGLPIVAAAATPDSGGYWLVDADGKVFSFGDALRLSTFSPVRATSPVVGIAVTPDGTGAWMAERNGTVLNFGTAAAHGSITGLLTGSHITSIAAIWVPPPSTLAYDLAETDGKVAAIGGAAYYGSRVRQAPGRTHRLHRPHP